MNKESTDSNSEEAEEPKHSTGTTRCTMKVQEDPNTFNYRGQLQRERSGLGLRQNQARQLVSETAEEHKGRLEGLRTSSSVHQFWSITLTC